VKCFLDPASMMEKLARDPTADVATVMGREPVIPQLNENSSPPSIASPGVISPGRPYGPTPMKASKTGERATPANVDSPAACLAAPLRGESKGNPSAPIFTKIVCVDEFC